MENQQIARKGLYYRSHITNLLLHLCNFFLTRPDVSLEFFNLIIKHELEFLQFLSLLLQIRYSFLLILNSFISFLELFNLSFFFFLKVVIRFQESLDFIFDFSVLDLLLVDSLGLKIEDRLVTLLSD